MGEGSINADYARAYGEAGFCILPLCWPDAKGGCACGRGHTGKEIGKVPVTLHGNEDATSDGKQIQTWWEQWPQANIGANLEKSKLCVLDIDIPDANVLWQVMQELGIPDGTATVKTGNGYHLYFRAEGLPQVRRIKPNKSCYDVLAKGYVIMPPSQHKTGGKYVFVEGGFERVLPAPERIAELLTQQPAAPKHTQPPDAEKIAGKVLTPLPRFIEETWVYGRNTGDRSGEAYNLARLLVEHGVKDPVEIACVVVTSEAHKDKFLGRKDAWEDACRVTVRALEQPAEIVPQNAPPQKGKPQINQQHFKKSPILTNMENVKPEKVRWLWEPYIPLGKLIILEGDPEVGKTWLALAISSTVTVGAAFPGQDGHQTRREPGNVIYMTAEDDLSDTIRIRLDSMHADVSRIYVLSGCTVYDPFSDSSTETIITLSDLDVFRQALEECRPALVVIDPLQAYLGARVDINRANEVRPVLSGMRALAEEFGCAILLVRHLVKSSRDKALYRGLGSIDFSAIARSVLLVGQDPDTKQRALIQTKCSVKQHGESIDFTITDDGLAWLGVSELTSARAFMPEKAPEDKTALGEARNFLEEVLVGGALPWTQVEHRGAIAGMNTRTLRRARESLNLSKSRVGNQTFWFLPKKATQGTT